MNPIDENTFSGLALEVLRTIESAGHQAWIVGGCVRDAILGRASNDVDMATSASWEEVERICQATGMRVRRSGIKHGTVTVLVPVSETVRDEGAQAPGNGKDVPEDAGYEAFEVTTYRIDSPSSTDSRHPDYVEFTDSITEDLARRDFTMNAMAWHPERGLLDPFGGLVDIEARNIRVVGDPSKRFKEDALRILRGCRFASQLGFDIDARTLRYMLSHKSLLLKISPERITGELDLFLMGDYVHDAIMEYVDVLSICVPELVAMKGFEQRTQYHIYDVLEHTAWAVQLAKKSLLVRWAAFCHDMGKPSCSFFDENGVQHFYGHAVAGERITRELLHRMSLRNAFKDDICALVRNHNDVIEPTHRCVRRALARLGGRVDLMQDLFELKTADMLAHAPEYTSQTTVIEDARRTLSDILESNEAFSLRQLAVNGQDVITLGVEPGPEIGRILDALLEEVIEGRLENDREALLAHVREIAS